MTEHLALQVMMEPWLEPMVLLARPALLSQMVRPLLMERLALLVTTGWLMVSRVATVATAETVR